MIEVPFGATFGETADQRFDRLGRGPLLDKLSEPQRKAARARMRCEHDRTVLAVVVGDEIITTIERRARSVHDEDILMACFKCPDAASDYTAQGRRVRRWEREASTRAIWRQVDRRRRDIALSDVLAPGSLVEGSPGS